MINKELLPLNEAIGVVKGAAAEIADAIPENNYWGFSTYTMILPSVLKEIGAAIELPQAGFTGPLWNYLDAACSAVVGISQLADKTNHRQVTTKVKGVINLLNSAQLTTLTAVNFSLLGAPGFAIAFGVGFAMSLEDTTRAARRLTSLDYWLKDSLTLLQKTMSQIKELKTEIAELEQVILQNPKSTMTKWALQHKKARLGDKAKNDTGLYALKTKLEGDITARLAKIKYDSFSSDSQSKTIDQYITVTGLSFSSNEKMKKFTEDLKQIDICQSKDDLNNRLSDSTHLGKYLKCNLRDPMRVCNNRDQQVRLQCKAELKGAVKNNFIWGMAFIGMTLICIPTPATQTAGLVIVSLASAIYLIKNAARIKSGICSLASSLSNLFSKPKAIENSGYTTDTEEPLLDTSSDVSVF